MPRSALTEIDVADVDVIMELYPRRLHADRIVAQYRKALNLLPPVTVAKQKGGFVLIDGYHRLLAHRLENAQTIAAEVVSCEDVLLEAIRRNADHGYQLEDGDKRRNAVLLYTRAGNPIKDEEELAAILRVSRRAIRGYLSNVKQEEKAERNQRMLEMWLDCYSQEEIAEATGEPRQTVDRLLKMEALPEWADPPASLQQWTLWEEWQDCDDRFGCDYPGRMPGQVVENLLYYLTEPGDCVLDPMAGSGTTRDVCQAMGRRCFSSDAQPLPGKSYIRQHAIPKTGKLPDPPGTVKRGGGLHLVVLDPPYWKQADYGDDKEIVGAQGKLEDYIDWVSRIVASSLGLVGKGGFVALIASSSMVGGKVVDPIPIWEATAIDGGGTVWDRVIVPYTAQRASGPQVAMAQSRRRLLRRHRDLVVFERPKAGS